MKRETLIWNLTDKYTYWLVPKLTPIDKRAKFTSERLGKMIIRNGMTE